MTMFVRLVASRAVSTLWGASAVVLVSAAAVQAGGRLVSYEDATRCGLVRSWYAQAPVDTTRSRVSQWKLQYDRAYAVTTSGLLAAFNAETGETLWTTSIGAAGAAAFGPGANLDYLAVVSASRLYLIDRNDGHVIWQRDLGSAPAAGPALSDEYAYVSLVNGRVEAFSLNDSAAQPWYYQSEGRTFQRPTHSGDVICWPTTTGRLYVCSANKPNVLFRLQTNDEIVAPPTEQSPYLFAASRDGYLYCVHEITGAEKWRFSAGDAIESQPVVIGDTAYVASREPALYAVDVKTGAELWRVRGLDRFAARGKDRVYAGDAFGNFYVIDAKTGRTVNGLTGVDGVHALVNEQTDRVFLADELGLLQCLHEVGAEAVVMHRVPPTPGAAQPVAPAEETEENPFAADDEPLDEDEPIVEEDEAFPADEPADFDEDEGMFDDAGADEPLSENPFE
ncbi:MAG: PQQ-binding-like beta-propeller repeat protein [Pirellulales bacterium]|nr:PQQ-binding-like beta-propeller repeat protein [Pirellulales bacterium]